MALVGLLVNQRSNRLRYLVTQDGDAGTTLVITTTGAASPDFLTDTLAGKLRAIAKAFTDGYGAFAAGALVQAQARALWLSDRSTSPGSTEVIMTARCEVTPRTGTTAPLWSVDANVDGSGHPTITVTGPAAAGTAYLDVELEGGAIGA
jgi:hypothetical protein